MSATSRAGLSGLIQWVLWTLLGAVIVMAAMWGLTLWPPAWWVDPAQLKADANSDLRGRELEQNLASAIQRIRPDGEPWAISIRDGDINAWIAARLPLWKEHDPSLAWPLEDAFAQVHFAEGMGIVAMGIQGRVWSGGFAAAPMSDAIVVEPGDGAVGRLPIPGGAWLVTRLMEGDGAKNLKLPSSFRLSDGRVVEIRRISFGEGTVEIEFVTRR